MTSILLIDCNRRIAPLLSTTLFGNDSITLETNAYDAMDALYSNSEFELVIADLETQIIEGEQLIACIRSLQQHIPIILMSQHLNEHLATYFQKQYNVSDYLCIPSTTTEQLALVVEKSLESRLDKMHS